MRLQAIPPLLRDLYGVAVFFVLVSTHSLSSGVLDQLAHVERVHSVQDIPEVSAVGETAFCCWIWHVLHHVPRISDEGIDVLDAQLVVTGHVDRLQVCQRHKLLFIRQHALDEVLVEHLFGWHVQL